MRGKTSLGIRQPDFDYSEVQGNTSMTDTSKTVVSADWVHSRLAEFSNDDPSLRLVEVDLDPTVYEDGHIPGAIGFDWQTQLRDPTTFDIPQKDGFEKLLGDAGLTADSTVVLYGDVMNWFAAYAYWLFTHYGHDDVRLLDGGRDYWIENGYPSTVTEPEFTPQTYDSDSPRESIRVDQTDVFDAIDSNSTAILDVRMPAEYRGDILAPPGWNEGVQRGGHIPGAINIPWSTAVLTDGRFKPIEELEVEYFQSEIDSEDRIIVYCRIGERSAHTWFVLHELLGYESVQHYYGSWVEWGNTVGAPIEQATTSDRFR